MLALRNSFHLNFIDGIQIDTKTQNVPPKFVKNLLFMGMGSVYTFCFCRGPISNFGSSWMKSEDIISAYYDLHVPSLDWTAAFAASVAQWSIYCYENPGND